MCTKFLKDLQCIYAIWVQLGTHDVLRHLLRHDSFGDTSLHRGTLYWLLLTVRWHDEITHLEVAEGHIDAFDLT